MRDLFDRGWISGQIDYHAARSRAYCRRDRVLTLLIYALFLGTLLAALLHAIKHVEWPSIVLLAIALPAFGAAFGGYRELREFGLHSERYRRAEHRLRFVREHLRNTDEPAEIRSLVGEAYTIMLEESLDWFGVLEFHNLEIVV